MKRFLFFIIRLLFFIILPFFLLVRVSVFLHWDYQVYPWLAVIGGIIASGIVLLFYALYHMYNFTGRLGSLSQIKRTYWVVTALVLVYCAPGLLYLSAANAKSDTVRKEFRTLHPVLRLGISTLVILDKNLILTDANRYPEDYGKMGLPTKNHSLHYKQSNGFVHAVDLRTRGKSEWRNHLVSWYFRALGFNTLRHVGTADHLHVSISSHDRPRGI